MGFTNQHISTPPFHTFFLLPSALPSRTPVYPNLFEPPGQHILEDIVAKQREEQAITVGISTLVKKYSQQQIVKGILTAGLVKSVVYAAQKVKSSRK